MNIIYVDKLDCPKCKNCGTETRPLTISEGTAFSGTTVLETDIDGNLKKETSKQTEVYICTKCGNKTIIERVKTNENPNSRR